MAEPFQPPGDVASFLRRYESYLVFGHIEPDGDCVASQLVLSSFLKRRGKQVSVFSEGPFDRPEIKSHEDTKDIKIIVLSAYLDEEKFKIMKENGADVCFSKPLPLPQLKEEVAQLLGLRN